MRFVLLNLPYPARIIHLINNIYKFIKYYLFCRIIHRAPPGPLFIYLELTKDCNLRCQFCDLWRIKHCNLENIPKELSLNEVINLIDEAKIMGTLLVHLYGGETLLRPDIVEVVREIKKRDLAVSLVTNATLLSDKMIKDLLEAGLRHIVISLDSAFPEIHDEMRGVIGTYEKVVQSIKNIKKISNKMKISINTVITKKNFKYLTDILELSNKLKTEAIKFILIHKIYPNSFYSPYDKNLFFNTLDERTDLEKELNKTIDFLFRAKIETSSYEFLKGISNFYKNKNTKFKCLAGYILCEIDCFGNIYPCCSLGEIVGNIREDKFSKIWNSEKFNHQRKRMINCRDCWMNCYIEPSLRFSLKYQIKNFSKTIREYKQYLC